MVYRSKSENHRFVAISSSDGKGGDGPLSAPRTGIKGESSGAITMPHSAASRKIHTEIIILISILALDMLESNNFCSPFNVQRWSIAKEVSSSVIIPNGAPVSATSCARAVIAAWFELLVRKLLSTAGTTSAAYSSPGC